MNIQGLQEGTRPSRNIPATVISCFPVGQHFEFLETALKINDLVMMVMMMTMITMTMTMMVIIIIMMIPHGDDCLQQDDDAQVFPL